MVVGWYHLGQGDSTDSKACEGVRCVRILLGKHMQVWPWQLELRQTSRSCFETTEDWHSLSVSVYLAQFPRNILWSALLTSQKWSTSSSSTSWQIYAKSIQKYPSPLRKSQVARLRPYHWHLTALEVCREGNFLSGADDLDGDIMTMFMGLMMLTKKSNSPRIIIVNHGD